MAFNYLQTDDRDDYLNGVECRHHKKWFVSDINSVVTLNNVSTKAVKEWVVKTLLNGIDNGEYWKNVLHRNGYNLTELSKGNEVKFYNVCFRKEYHYLNETDVFMPFIDKKSAQAYYRKQLRRAMSKYNIIEWELIDIFEQTFYLTFEEITVEYDDDIYCPKGLKCSKIFNLNNPK